MKPEIFASGMGYDNNVMAKGDLIFTFELIIKNFPKATKIEITIGIWSRVIEDREEREIEILCENNKIKIVKIVGQHTINDQFFRVFNEHRLIAQSGRTTIR